ncbi:MAG TPA: ROK family protein, partial [Desulfobacteria bacterium]|nr:ROK family protein [Desulfobacteria bacterium]
MNHDLAIGLDLGGTNIKGILLDTDGKIHAKTDIATQAGDGPEAVVRRMGGMVSELEKAAKKAGRKAVGVGIGIPGLPDKKTGLVVFAPNLGWKNVPLLKLL